MTIVDRWYQEEGLTALFEFFVKNRNGNPVLAWPTGTGKSIIPAKFIQRCLAFWPRQRFAVLTHVKELVEQNAKRMIEIWPTAPIGIYSAGLKSRDTIQPIIFGGVASVVKNAEAFGHIDMLFIDECHLLSLEEDTMYQTIINVWKRINPDLKVVGLTATPFRAGQGLITDEGGLFTSVCHDMTTIDAYNRLIAEGFLSPVIPRRTRTELDISEVGMNRGDYAKKDLQKAVDKEQITFKALEEACALGKDRSTWLAFASGVEHAEHIAAMLDNFGVSAAAVHSKMPSEERDRRIAAFKAGEIRCIANNNVLTTGFDHAPIDMIIMLRPTMSAGLWVQMLGRGTRPSPDTGKQNCLVLDFAGNTKRLGPINDPRIPRKKGEKPGDVPIKICDFCGVYNHTRATHCIACGNEFQFKVKINDEASTQELLKSDLPEVHYFDVQRVVYNLMPPKNGKPSYIKASYFCGLQKFDVPLCFEHKGFARHKAHEFWRQHHSSEPPETTSNALAMISALRVPNRLRVWVNKLPFPEVLTYVK